MTEQSNNLSVFNVERWFPSEYNRGPNWLVWLGLISSFIAVFIKVWTPISVNRIPEALYTLTFFYALFVNFHWLKHDRIIQLFGLAITLPIVFFGINYLRDSVLALEYKSFDKLAKLFFFVPIAWWLGGNLRTIGWFLSTAFAGFMVACLLDPNLSTTIERLLNGGRVDFDILNAQHVALYASISLVGLLSFAPKWIQSPLNATRMIKLSIATIAILICVLIIVGTQTRAAWLALIVCGCMWLLITVFKIIKTKNRKRLLTPVIIMLSVALTLVFGFKEPITQRINTENTTLTALMSGDWDNIPYTSIGIRVNTWLEAGHWIGQRPLVGWGGSVRGAVIESSGRLPRHIKEQFGHFHNSYIEFTLAYGLIGLSIILAMLYELLKQTKLKFDSTINDKPINTFTVYMFVLLAVMNLFESYFFFWSGVFVGSVAFAPIYSQSLANTCRLTLEK